MCRLLYPRDDTAAQRMCQTPDIDSYSMRLVRGDLFLFVLKAPCRMAVPALITGGLLVGRLVGLTPQTVLCHWLPVLVVGPPQLLRPVMPLQTQPENTQP